MSNEIEGAMPPLPEPAWWLSHDVLFQKNRIDKLPVQALQPGAYQHKKLYTVDQLQAYAAPLVAWVEELQEERDRIERNRDMWKGQCERQAAHLTTMREALQLAGQSAGFQYMTYETRAAIDAAIAAKD